MPKRDPSSNGLEVHAQLDFDLRMIKDPLDQCRVAIHGKSLESLGQIAVVPVRSDRKSAAHARFEFARFAAPLFACVVLEKLFVQFDSYSRNNHPFGVFWLI